jgi:hypothetical protein
MAERVTTLTWILDVPGSILGRNTDYPVWGFFVIFPSPSKHTLGEYFNYSATASFHIPSTSFIKHQMIQRDVILSYWECGYVKNSGA